MSMGAFHSNSIVLSSRKQTYTPRVEYLPTIAFAIY